MAKKRSPRASPALKAVTDEEDAIEAIGDLRELLAEEDLLIPGAS